MNLLFALPPVLFCKRSRPLNHSLTFHGDNSQCPKNSHWVHGAAASGPISNSRRALSRSAADASPERAGASIAASAMDRAHQGESLTETFDHGRASECRPRSQALRLRPLPTSRPPARPRPSLQILEWAYRVTRAVPDDHAVPGSYEVGRDSRWHVIASDDPDFHMRYFDQSHNS